MEKFIKRTIFVILNLIDHLFNFQVFFGFPMLNFSAISIWLIIYRFLKI